MLASSGSPSKPVVRPGAQSGPSTEPDGAEAALVRALAGADTDACQAVWRRYHPLVTAMVRRRLRNEGDTEDLVQEVFLAVFKGARALREPLALRAFVLTITARAINRNLKTRRRRLQLAPDSPGHIDEVVGAHADATAKHAVAGLGKLMNRLRARERNAFLLHFVEGLDANGVARSLGVSAPTARRALLRACRYVHLWASRDPFLLDYLEPAARLSCSPTCS